MQYFETIKCDDYEVYNLDFHKRRIANTIGLNINLEEYIYPPNEKLLKCKVVYDENSIIDISYDDYTQKDISSFKIVYSDTIEYSKKYLNREDITALVDLKDEADEVIIVKNSKITDTSIANIAICLDDTWITPKSPLLYGTTRARLIEEGKLQEKDIDLLMLKKATKIATLNAMVGFNEIKEFKLL